MANIKSIYGNPVVDDNLRQSVATEYSSSSTYAVGDFSLKDGQLYECNTAISTAEAWTAAHWTAVTVGSEIATVKDGLSQLVVDGYIELHPAFERGGITNGENATFNSGIRMVSNLTVDIETTIKCETGYRYLIAYYQSDGTFISQTALMTTDTVLPVGTTFRILIRKQPDQYLPETTDPSIFTDHVHICQVACFDKEIAETNEKLDDLSVRALFNFIPTEYTVSDGVMSNTGAILFESAKQKRYSASVTEGDVVRVAGINYKSASYPLYLFRNDGNIVSYYHETVDANSYLTKTVMIPSGVDEIIVNQTIGFGDGEIAIAGSNGDYDFPKVNTYYTDTNEVLWIGTSIPEGATYPQKACEANGYKCINRSLGSSKLCFENTYISGSDVNKGKRLTATVAELEALYRADVTAGTITEATLNMWKNYSYENSILPYINGTNPRQVSMIVIDHGYNDRGTIYNQMQDVNNIDWDSVDRSTFTGAFKYLLNKIQEINPFIKIVISGYFTNTVTRLAFSYNAPQICGMQELIGEHYGIYVMKAWEHTQINPVHVAGTSTYIDDFNATYGTSYTPITPDANGNITALQLYCPDGIHPHTDKTGRCNKRLNAVYTKLLAHTI